MGGRKFRVLVLTDNDGLLLIRAVNWVTPEVGGSEVSPGLHIGSFIADLDVNAGFSLSALTQAINDHDAVPTGANVVVITWFPIIIDGVESKWFVVDVCDLERDLFIGGDDVIDASEDLGGDGELT